MQGNPVVCLVPNKITRAVLGWLLATSLRAVASAAIQASCSARCSTKIH